MANAMPSSILLGIDTGGTFTDFVLLRDGRLRTLKIASTPHDPSLAILQGMTELHLDADLLQHRLRIVHGSTVATNALLEGRLARTLYVGNRGFEDVPVLARQARRELYALQPRPEPDLVANDLRVGTGGRLSIQGELLEALTDDDLLALEQHASMANVEAVAVNLLYSYRDSQHEQRIAQRLRGRYFVSCSSDVLPEYREYERGVATYLNAALGPGVAGYLKRLAESTAGNNLAIMMSSGGTIDAEQAAVRAVTLLLSGPAGGVVAATRLAEQHDSPKLITFDMGGTSTDIALLDGGVQLTSEGRIAGLPIAIPMADIHTIGAGGGSIASIDSGGLLQVGPRSAGADPGPACYGRGGEWPTVTDANVVLGRLPTFGFLNGQMELDIAAAKRAIARIATPLNLTMERVALGIIEIANENMIAALRLISVERGHDPRSFGLCCFGGAGGMHVCALADALGITRILLPPAGSVFSALGMLQANPSRQLTRAIGEPVQHAAGRIVNIARELIAAGRKELARDGVPLEDCAQQVSLDLRYQGQSYYLNLGLNLELNLALTPAAQDAVNINTLTAQFHDLHARRYGHSVDAPVELVNIRVRLHGPAPMSIATLPAESIAQATHAGPEINPTTPRASTASVAAEVYQRVALHEAIDGPAIVAEPYTCTWLAPGWRAAPAAHGTLELTRRNPLHK